MKTEKTTNIKFKKNYFHSLLVDIDTMSENGKSFEDIRDIIIPKIKFRLTKSQKEAISGLADLSEHVKLLTLYSYRMWNNIEGIVDLLGISRNEAINIINDYGERKEYYFFQFQERFPEIYASFKAQLIMSAATIISSANSGNRIISKGREFIDTSSINTNGYKGIVYPIIRFYTKEMYEAIVNGNYENVTLTVARDALWTASWYDRMNRLGDASILNVIYSKNKVVKACGISRRSNIDIYKNITGANSLNVFNIKRKGTTLSGFVQNMNEFIKDVVVRIHTTKDKYLLLQYKKIFYKRFLYVFKNRGMEDAELESNIDYDYIFKVTGDDMTQNGRNKISYCTTDTILTEDYGVTGHSVTTNISESNINNESDPTNN